MFSVSHGIKTSRLRIFYYFPLTWQRFVVWSRHYLQLIGRRRKEAGKQVDEVKHGRLRIFQSFSNDLMTTTQIKSFFDYRVDSLNLLAHVKNQKDVSSINFYRAIDALLPISNIRNNRWCRDGGRNRLAFSEIFRFICNNAILWNDGIFDLTRVWKSGLYTCMYIYIYSTF